MRSDLGWFEPLHAILCILGGRIKCGTFKVRDGHSGVQKEHNGHAEALEMNCSCTFSFVDVASRVHGGRNIASLRVSGHIY